MDNYPLRNSDPLRDVRQNATPKASGKASTTDRINDIPANAAKNNEIPDKAPDVTSNKSIDSDIGADSGETAKGTPIGAGLDVLLSNPELLSSLSGILKNMGSPNRTDAESVNASAVSADAAVKEQNDNTSAKSDSDIFSGSGLSSVLSNPEIMSKLPDMIAVLKPMLSSQAGASVPHPPKNKTPADNRTALLLALKPYLDPKRCEAVDYLMKLNRLTDILKNLS